MKKYLLLLFSFFIVFHLMYSIEYFFTHESRPKHLECGDVQGKWDRKSKTKYGCKEILFLDVYFDKTGFKSIEVDTKTYFRFKKYERICLDIDDNTPIMHEFTMLFALIYLVIIFLLFVYFIANFSEFNFNSNER